MMEENSSRNSNQPMLYFSSVSISIFPQQGASRKRCFLFLYEILHQIFATSSRSLIHFPTFKFFHGRKSDKISSGSSFESSLDTLLQNIVCVRCKLSRGRWKIALRLASFQYNKRIAR